MTVWRPINAVECPKCSMIYNADDVEDTCKQCGYSPMFKIADDGDNDERT